MEVNQKELENKILNIIKKANEIKKFTSPAKYQNTVSCQCYKIDRVLLECPNNGCSSFAVYVNEVNIGRIESDLIYDELHKAMTRIKNDLFNSI
jgi:hypothetical protein